jgi:branched-chain amino acid transport system permease protein
LLNYWSRPSPRRITYGLAAGGAVALAIAESSANQFQAYLFGVFATYALIATGLNLVVGSIGYISAGHAGLAAIGAYAGLLTLRLGLVPALLIAVAAGIVAGALMGAPALRVQGFGVAVLTFVIGQGIPVAIAQSSALGGYFGQVVPIVRLFGFKFAGLTLTILALSVLGLGVLAAALLQRSMVGLAWSALRENEGMAASLAVHPHRQRILAFAISGGFAGAGGLLLIMHTRYVSPDLFSLALSVDLLAMVVVGGRNSFLGPLLGAGFFVLGERLIPGHQSQTLVFGIALAAMVWLAPDGIVGLLKMGLQRIRRLTGAGETVSPPKTPEEIRA